MDFAPYQSSPPETQRAFSPPLSQTTSPRQSLEYNNSAAGRRSYSPLQRPSPPPLQHPQPQRQWNNFPGFGSNTPTPPSHGQASPNHPQQGQGLLGGIGGGGGGGGGITLPGSGYRDGVSEFDTSLGIRLDYEACLAYLAFPPLGAILLLILERKSDYVRFHAWQSSFLFTALFVLHLMFSWSGFLSWTIFLLDLVAMAWLAWCAWRDADGLDRWEVPIFGRIAGRVVDDE